MSKYLVRWRNPGSQTWRTFLENHLTQLVSIDFFTLPTIRFQILYLFLVLAHDRRRIVHWPVTAMSSSALNSENRYKTSATCCLRRAPLGREPTSSA